MRQWKFIQTCCCKCFNCGKLSSNCVDVVLGMDKIHFAVAWYQTKIGSYDKQLWEQSVEQRVLKGIQHAPRKSGRVKTELIDVDLVRGSTFSKAKPQVPWAAITQRAILRVIFFPLFYKWWVQQTSWKFWCFLLSLYSLQVAASVVYMLNMGDYLTQENVTFTEVLVPFVLMVVLALVHSQTVLTHWSHKPLVRDNKSKRDGARGRHNKNSSQVPKTGDQESVSEKTNSGQSDEKSSRSDQLKTSRKHHQCTRRSTCHGKSRNKGSCNGTRSPTRENQTWLKDQDPQVKVPEETDEGDQAVSYNSLKYSSTPTSEGTITGDKSFEKNTPTFSVENLANGSAQKSVCMCVLDSCSCQQNAKKSHGCIEKSMDLSHLEKSVDFSHHDWEVQDKAELPDSSISSRQRKESNEKLLKANGTSGEESSGSFGKFEILPSVTKESCGEHGVNGSNGFDTDSVLPREDSMFDLESRDAEDNPRDCLNVSFSKDEEETTSYDDEQSCSTTSNEREIRRKRFNIRYQKKLTLDCSNRVKDLKPPHQSCRNCCVDDTLNYSPKGCENKDCCKTLKSSTQGEITQTCSLNDNRYDNIHDIWDDGCFKIRRTYSVGHGSLRRRKNSGGAEGSHEVGCFTQRTRRVPTSLGVRMQDLKESTGLSSSDGETSPTSPLFSKGALSSEEWEFRIQSDVATSTSSASSCASDREMSGEDAEVDDGDTVVTGSGCGIGATSSSAMHVINLLQPPSTASLSHPHNTPQPDKVSCVIWEGNECKKVDLTALDIGWAIIEKVDAIPESSDYILIGLAFSMLIGLVPLVFRAYLSKSLNITSLNGTLLILNGVLETPWQLNLIAVNGVLQRFCLSMIFFFLLSVADRTFKQRLLYAKHFCYLTSSRRAKKYDMPHFRLNKVRNIKMWLSLRSYLKKRGPQRSVDVIVSSAFMLSITHLAMMCIQLLKDTDKFLDSLCNWELCAWCMALGVYLLRFMTLGLKINKKYRNLSVLITEQINLYLQMEQKPHKKEELMLANNVLKLAEDLLKELESPFKISGMSANPFVYNATKVVLLSAFSAVLTELLGFKLKLYKIKIP